MNKGLSTALFLLFYLFTNISDTAAQSGSVPFLYAQSLVFVKVKINNKPGLTFLLNTGANASVLNTQTANMVRLPEIRQDSVMGTAGKEMVKILKAAKIQIGDAHLENVLITKRDLTKWPSPDGKALDGILGTDFLQHFYVTIDFKAHKIQFTAKKPSVKYLYNFPFVKEEDIPKMTVVLNDSLRIPLRYNSGVSLAPNRDIFINVSYATWRTLKNIDKTLTPDHYLTGTAVGGNVYLPVVPIRTMEIDDFIVRQPYVIVQPEEGYFKREDAVGFLGNNFMEKFERICISFDEQKIFFNIPRARAANIIIRKQNNVVLKKTHRRT
jgi:predicted aspartyl protease